jgi:hypothetical protein
MRAICHDPQFRDRWGTPSVIGIVQFIINDSISSESGIRRFDSMFGSRAGTYMKMPDSLAPSARSPLYLRLLDDDLQRLQTIMSATHRAIIASRSTDVNATTQNLYLEDELVLYRRDPTQFYPTKLSLPCIGPYSVISQVGNRVQARHLSTGVVRDMPVTNLKIYHGTLEAAKAAADQDEDQYNIVAEELY